jgi:hypothetical protein
MQASRVSVEEASKRVATAKAKAREHNRDLDVYTVGVISCRPTMKGGKDERSKFAHGNSGLPTVPKLLRAPHGSRHRIALRT